MAPRICAPLTVSKEILFVERKERGKKVLLRIKVVYMVYVVCSYVFNVAVSSSHYTATVE
jgi:hypothetical protein